MPVKRPLLRGFAHTLILLGCVLGGTLVGDRALAQTCSLSITPLAFGSVDVTANVEVQATATATVTCSGVIGLPVTIGVCIDLGQGTGGGTSASNRFMINGANQLRYGLYTNGGAMPWGSSAWPAGGASAVSFLINPPLGGSVSRTEVITGRVHAGQSGAAPVPYASTLSGGEARIRYGVVSFLLGCDLLTTTQTTSFTVTANVPPTCRVTASTLNFGSAGVLSTARDATAALTPTCTNGTSYRIGLNGGLTGATDPTQRHMVKGAEAVAYGLFRDAGRSQPFGETPGVDTQSGIGSGLAQSLTIYGRVPPQQTPSPGPYSDTVIATITY